jgi:beta-glucanase (GH16 family)
MTVHWHTKAGPRHQGESYVGPDFSRAFHVFAVEWEKDEIRWYVDGVMRFRVNKNIPGVPMRIILNTAVGGNWPGPPGKKTVFPQYHFIDYVRVFERTSQ